MVQKAVAATGAVLSAAGVGLMVASALMESFVVVVVPDDGDNVLCEDKNLGNLGIFTASYDAACTEGSPYFDTFKEIKKIESDPTTEFPLLFSSQTGLPMFANPALPFESCETFWAPYGAAEGAAFGKATDIVFNGVDEQLVGLAPLISSIPQSVGEIGTFVTGLWYESAVSTAALLETELGVPSTGTVGSIKGGADATIAALQGVLSCEQSNYAACANLAAPGDAVAQGGIVTAATCDCATEPSCAPTVAAVANDTANPCALVQGVFKTKLEAGVIAGTAAAEVQESLETALSCCTVNPDAACFETVRAMANATSVDGTTCAPTAEGIRSGVVTTLETTVATLEDASTLLGLADQGLTVAENAAEGIYTLPDDFTSTDEDALCVLLYLDSQQPSRKFNESSVETDLSDSCTFKTSAKILAENVDAVIPQLLGEQSFGSLEGLVTQVVTGLMTGFADCANGGSSPVGGCVNATVYGTDTNGDANSAFPSELAITGIPENFVSPDWFYARMFGASSAIGVLDLLKTSFAADPNADPVVVGGLQAAGGLLGICAAELSATTKSACQEGLKSPQVLLLLEDLAAKIAAVSPADCSTEAGRNAVADAANATIPDEGTCVFVKSQIVTADNLAALGLFDTLVNTATEAVIPGNTSDARITSCKDDDTDKEIFETAQMLVPAAIGLAAVGMLLSFGAVATNKKVLGIVGGLFAVLGGGVLLGALLYVRTAPVYSLVSDAAPIDEAESGEALYIPGLAQTLALGAIGAPILGGLITLGGSFCGNAEDESAITAKVDGTY